ncbi:uncharacterized protein HaLaN_15155 [Haematococcus lacustris]|uniref:WD_REPEATS_REGION domain-containing protein n=1 Tax=Haematococcus lacustris TaxID=44745 RepID=A0A699Z869_HAELA|nr:uncharacterized protein HaLaN_15155 [Haematococcus lacustris]
MDGKGMTIKFSYDGSRIEIGGEKGSVLIWDIKNNCLLYDIKAHDGKWRLTAPAECGQRRQGPAVGLSSGHGRKGAWHTAKISIPAVVTGQAGVGAEVQLSRV